jgi:hypothetical protein
MPTQPKARVHEYPGHALVAYTNTDVGKRKEMWLALFGNLFWMELRILINIHTVTHQAKCTYLDHFSRSL